MKKVIQTVAFAAAAAVIAANIYVIQKPNVNLNSLNLDNVETLAEGEPGDDYGYKLYYPLSTRAYKVAEVVSGTASDNNIPGCPINEGFWGITTGSGSYSNSTTTRIIYCIPCEGCFGMECQNSYFEG